MSYDVTIFGINLTLDPIAFTLPIGKNGWDIYWYGIIIATGFLLALIYGFKNAKRLGIEIDPMLDVVLVTTPVAILCARAYYVIFDGEKLDGIGDFFGFGNSSGFAGIAIYGGVIGAALCGFLMCKLRRVKFFDMVDLAALGFLIGQGIGRWGNFVNQEAYGAFTGSTWWGMQSNKTIIEMGGEGLVHPCFLYESIWCIAGFFVLHHISKKRRFSGEIALCYGAWYGAGRAVIELLRTDSLMLGKIRVSSLLSVILCLASIALIVYNRSKCKETAHDSEYGAMFEAENESAEENDGEPCLEENKEEATETEENEDVQDN